MFRIKRLYSFILQTFLPLFLMTFFIVLFIVLMQFLWKYIDDMVGKGLELSVLAELFFYAALSLIPMSLPLALLLASLMTFGNLGERLELLAMKAAGVSLTQIMKPLIFVIILIAVGAFFFQNNILPKAQVKLWTLMYSMRQKSPELDIPEGSFYDQISGYNLYVSKKNRDTGMLYDLMIYDLSKGFDDAMVIVSDSGKLKLTDDKRFLFLTLYNGESFENLKNQRTTRNNIPYRRETFGQKEILIEFDGNFNRMDDGVMQNMYIGKDMAELKSSVDSMDIRLDSIGQQNGNSLRNSGYFSLYNYNAGPEPEMVIKDINLDSIYNGMDKLRYQTVLDRARSRAETIRQDNEYKSYTLRDEKRIIRRHEIEMHKKFTLSFACLIFFFIGAPLGAIIRKGGLGTPVVISILLFIFYYIIDNTGYKMAREGIWYVYQGMWLSSAVLLPLGIFLTYKAVNDSVVFNSDTYQNALKKLFGMQQARNIQMKEVILNDISETDVVRQIGELNALSKSFLRNDLGSKRQHFLQFWTSGKDLAPLRQINEKLESLVEYTANDNRQLVLTKLMDYPILLLSPFIFPIKNRVLGMVLMVILPLSLPVYLLGLWQQKKLRHDIETIIKTGTELNSILDKD